MKRAAVLFCLVACVAAHAFAGERGPVTPSPKDKCPVCGMFVKKYPDWTSQIVFKDGSYAFFDGAKDMFKYYFDVKRYAPSKSASDIASFCVMDYYALTPMDGREAYYVIDSDVFGPMGKELIPFEKQADAKGFLKDHKGKGILRFTEVTPQIVKGLDQ